MRIISYHYENSEALFRGRPLDLFVGGRTNLVPYPLQKLVIEPTLILKEIKKSYTHIKKNSICVVASEIKIITPMTFEKICSWLFLFKMFAQKLYPHPSPFPLPQSNDPPLHTPQQQSNDPPCHPHSKQLNGPPFCPSLQELTDPPLCPTTVKWFTPLSPSHNNQMVHPFTPPQKSNDPPLYPSPELSNDPPLCTQKSNDPPLCPHNY